VICSALFVHVSNLGLAGGIIDLRGVKVKGLTVVIIPAILLRGVASIGLGDTHISIAATYIPDIQNDYQPNKSKEFLCNCYDYDCLDNPIW